MGDVNEINIKNQAYYYFDDMIDVRNFHSDLLKIDKKSYRDIDIYNIGYITIKKSNLCDGCYNIMQKSMDFKNIAIVYVKKSAYRIYFLYMSKREAKKLMTNSNLIDKKGVL